MYSDSVASTIDIVIPVLNEAKTLEVQVEKLLDFVNDRKDLDIAFMVTIADNGSTDATLAIALEIARKFMNVRVVSVGSRGVGLALKSAWNTSKCDFVGYTDLDLATNLRHLIEVEAALLGSFDCVFGSRLLPESVVVGRSLKRTITSKIFNRVVRYALNTSISDGMCGFKFLKRELLPGIYQEGADSDGWFFCTEIAVAAESAGNRILEIPVFWKDDQESKVKIPSLTIEYLKDILKFRRRRGNLVAFKRV